MGQLMDFIEHEDRPTWCSQGLPRLALDIADITGDSRRLPKGRS